LKPVVVPSARPVGRVSYDPSPLEAGLKRGTPVNREKLSEALHALAIAAYPDFTSVRKAGPSRRSYELAKLIYARATTHVGVLDRTGDLGPTFMVFWSKKLAAVRSARLQNRKWDAAFPRVVLCLEAVSAAFEMPADHPCGGTDEDCSCHAIPNFNRCLTCGEEPCGCERIAKLCYVCVGCDRPCESSLCDECAASCPKEEPPSEDQAIRAAVARIIGTLGGIAAIDGIFLE
jgi:hypothetical protein